MGKKKRPKKKLPKSLISPVISDDRFYLLAALGVPLDDLDVKAKQVSDDDALKQVTERISAVYEYFKIDPAEPNSKDRLIFALCRKCFMQTFSIRSKKSNAGRKTREWTFENQLELVVIVNAFERANYDKQRAYEWYVCVKENGMDPRSVKSRYYQALNKIKSSFNPAQLDGAADKLWRELIGPEYK